MPIKRAPDRWIYWYLATERIAKELKKYYRASYAWGITTATTRAFKKAR